MTFSNIFKFSLSSKYSYWISLISWHSHFSTDGVLLSKLIWHIEFQSQFGNTIIVCLIRWIEFLEWIFKKFVFFEGVGKNKGNFIWNKKSLPPFETSKFFFLSNNSKHLILYRAVTFLCLTGSDHKTWFKSSTFTVYILICIYSLSTTVFFLKVELCYHKILP